MTERDGQAMRQVALDAVDACVAAVAAAAARGGEGIDALNYARAAYEMAAMAGNVDHWMKR